MSSGRGHPGTPRERPGAIRRTNVNLQPAIVCGKVALAHKICGAYELQAHGPQGPMGSGAHPRIPWTTRWGPNGNPFWDPNGFWDPMGHSTCQSAHSLVLFGMFEYLWGSSSGKSFQSSFLQSPFFSPYMHVPPHWPRLSRCQQLFSFRVIHEIWLR